MRGAGSRPTSGFLISPLDPFAVVIPQGKETAPARGSCRGRLCPNSGWWGDQGRKVMPAEASTGGAGTGLIFAVA